MPIMPPFHVWLGGKRTCLIRVRREKNSKLQFNGCTAIKQQSTLFPFSCCSFRWNSVLPWGSPICTDDDDATFYDSYWRGHLKFMVPAVQLVSMYSFVRTNKHKTIWQKVVNIHTNKLLLYLFWHPWDETCM